MEREKPKLITSPLHLVIALLIFAALFFFFQAFLLKSYRIPSESMMPTIKPGDRIIVDRFAYRFSDPDVGDVAVFRAPEGAATGASFCQDKKAFSVCPKAVGATGDDFIKRIIAREGDRVSFRHGRLWVNGEEVYSQFRCPRKTRGCHFPRPITVPEGYYFMVGDNRENSYDSRFWGAVPGSWIIGKARLTYWPPKSFGAF